MSVTNSALGSGNVFGHIEEQKADIGEDRLKLSIISSWKNNTQRILLIQTNFTKLAINM